MTDRTPSRDAPARTAEPVLPGKAAPVGGLVLLAVGAAVAAGSIYGALTGGDSVGDAAALAVLGVLFGGALAAAGALLRVEKGGVALVGDVDAAATLRFRGAGARDVLDVPCRDVVAVRLVPRDEVWGRAPTRNWSCELLRRDAAPIVLAESSDYEAVWSVGRAVEHRLDIPLREEGEWSAPPVAADDEAQRTDAEGETGAEDGAAAGARSIAARRGGALARVLAVLGFVGVVLGAVLMSQVERAPIFGFLFGPTLFFLGVALAGAALTGWLARDVVSWTAAEIGRASRLGPLAWGRKAAPRTEAAYLRIHPRGLVGASLELVTRERTLVLVGGVTGASRLGYGGLLALAADLRRTLGLRTRSVGPPDAGGQGTGPPGPGPEVA